MKKCLRFILSFLVLCFVNRMISEIIDGFGCLEEIEFNPPLHVNYGRGIVEDIDSSRTYLGWFNLIFSFTSAFATYSFLSKGFLTKYDRLLTLSWIISSLILIPAYLIDDILIKNINSNILFNLLNKIVLASVIGFEYLLFRRFCFKKSKILGYNLYVLRNIERGVLVKYFFEAKSTKSVIDIISSNFEIRSSIKNVNAKKIRISSSPFSITETMKCKERFICTKRYYKG
jgi:hypothetical protein